MSRITVMIVDDSAVVRQVLQAQLAQDPAIEVLCAVADPLFARERMKARWPDVVVLDVEMPRMDGITFLKQIMAERPTPVIICSTLTEKGAGTTMDALGAGAFAVVAKPKIGLKQFLEDSGGELATVVKAAARARVDTFIRRAPKPVPAATPVPVREKLNADAMLPPPVSTAMHRTTERIVALGTSTGGTQALEFVLTSLPRVCPGVVVVQHMPEKFTAAFAARLDALCPMEVREARDGDRVMTGRVLIAPGGRHMMVKRSGAQYHVEVADGPLVSRHKPSVDVLFRSVAKAAGSNALGVIMTGMGDDGAHGLREMFNAHAMTAAQDEASCVVFGMPKEAIKLGAAQQVLGLDQIPALIQAQLND